MADVKVIRSSLKRKYKDSDEIIIAWWDRDWFEEILDRRLDEIDWGIILHESEHVLEFTDLGDQLAFTAERALDDAKRPRVPRRAKKPTKRKKTS
jgi:hypothetical protein